MIYRFLTTIARIFILGHLLGATAQATVCRAPGLETFDAAARRAKAYLPGNTSNIKEAAVYIEKDPKGGFYFHSNFVVEGFEYSTKIGGEDISSLEVALMNIVFYEYPSDKQRLELRRAMLENMIFYVSKDIFDEKGNTALDFDGRMRVVMIDPETKTSVGGLIIKTDKPPPFGAEIIDGCCLSGRPPGKDARSSKILLQKSNLKKENVRVISLVSDGATAQAIEGSSLRNMNLGKTGYILNEADINDLISVHKGKDIVVLGHVEGQNFVTRNAKNEVVSTVSIEKLRTSALNNDVLLIEIGCNTAGSATGSQMPGVAIATRFNTVDATLRLAKALDTSLNLGDFLVKLADETLQVVVDTKSIESRIQYHAAYYENTNRPGINTKVGDVTVTGRDTSFLSSIIPSWLRRR